MGSINDMSALKLDALRGKSFKGVSTETIVETIWAITHFVYIGDNEVNFVRYSVKPSTRICDAVWQQSPVSSVRSYRIHADATPADIAKSGSELKHDNGQDPALELDTTAPSFMQFIRQTGLAMVQDDTILEWQNGSGKHQPHPLLFSVRILEGAIQAVLLPNTTKHQDCLKNIEDTITRVCDLVAENWNSPLSQMNFLGALNWNHITHTAPALADIDSNVLCDILARQSRVRPDKLAVEAWDGNLTYAELQDYSLRMAALLLQKGVSLEERIGICMKKSKWSVVTIWAILQAGCTGVSLDIRNPSKRMEALLEKVEARLVVADQWTLPALDGLDIGILRCDSDALEAIDISAPNLQWPKLSPWTAAFITFTSGSTGLPKAVVAEHGPLYASTVAMADAIHLNEKSRTFQFSSFVSDMSIGEIFSTMLKGGCICVPSEEERLDNLPSALHKSRATHACLTSTVMSQVQPKDVPDLECMVATGEGLSKENFLRWKSHVEVITAYGITESIIYDSYATSKHLSSDHRNIGMARGTCLWVTDPNDPEKLKPVGAVGEILIEGPVLARGYMGDPKKTAERFILAPSWLQKLRGEKENHRCYRSGDYGLRNADETLIYLGRADTQVKLRGWRVELGEIEHNLLIADPRLGEIAVEAATFQSRGNQQALVAFVKRQSKDGNESLLLSMDENSRIVFQAAQSKLLESLPHHMVPSVFIPIRVIPRNTVGKRDRRTLHSLAGSLTEEQLSVYQLRGSFTARPPETPDQKLLQQLWAKTLRAAKATLGLDDNFFQVGGDSIKAIELVGELRDQGRTLAVSQIFQTPDLGEMAGLLGYLNEIQLEQPPKAFELIPESLSKEACIQEAAQACQLTIDLVEDIYPTIPMQEALMVVSAHRSGVYSHRVVFKIPESLDIERFKSAWEILVSEQPIFRTRVVTLPSMGTVQVITRYSIDWHSEMTLDEFVLYDDGTPFTYGSALSRYAIVRDKNNVLYFVWSGHHAISDGWSRPAMFDEVRHIYHNNTPTQQTPFAQVIRYIGQVNAEESDEFWKEQFQDSVELFPRLPSSDYIPQALQMRTLRIDLNRQAASNITTATLVQAAWALISAAYANADEAVFGLTLSGRDIPVAGITKVMGITIATVPVKVVLDNTSTISEYLEDVQEYVSQVKQHQHVGLQRISRLSPEARSAANFQNLLVIQPAGDEKDHSGLSDLGLQLVQREERDTSDFALTVQCIIDSERGSLQIKAHYDNKVIDDEQVECLLHFFEHVTSQLATESDTRSLHDIDRISPYDLSRLAKWNIQMPSTIEKTLHRLVEERAHETPDAIALDGFDGQVTYAELNFVSSQLAGYLQRDAGVGPESRVVLSFAKSKLPIFAMLAVLKSGGVCVSTNPEHPTTRLIELSKDAESNVMLCNEDSLDRFRGHLPHVIKITGLLLEELKSAPIHHSGPVVLPSNASFIVYTSGSTGKPKGSVLEHRSLATDLIALGQRIGLDAQSRTLQFSAYTFDAHILEIIGTLVHGGCVCVISDHERMNRLPHVIQERGVTFALLTKTVSRLLDPGEVPTLKTLILSGEANGRQDYWRWSESVRLFNGMGPSECTPLVCLTRGPVSPNDDPANIGHAMACHLWVIDHRRPDRLVPIGCVGELAVEGPIVGRGYVNRPKQNAAAFMLDPAWSRDSAGRSGASSSSRRFYRSGDLAKMNADGSITFIGRADSQVKIAGQRVELGEIEDNLRRVSHAFTASAVEALPISSRGGATALAVFCARDSNERNKSSAGSGDDEKPILPLDKETESKFQNAQAELSKALPQYMVPAIFIPVKNLPFNASGKLERKKLRDWVAGLDANELGRYYLTGSTTSKAPQTEKEKKLQALWAKVLNLPVNTIGNEANFFRSGGDSVLSMKLIAEARSEGIAMTVANVFRMPLLKDMALTMLESDNGRFDNDSTAIEPFSLYRDTLPLASCIQETAQDCGVTPDMIEDIYPCTPIQEALMAASSHRPEAYTYEVILKLPETMDLSRFKSSWEKLVSVHAIYRTRIVFRRDVGSLQVVLRSNITWQDTTGMSTEQYLAHDGPLLVEYGSELSRFAIVQHGGETVFVGRLHHALYDGWSMMRTYEEFSHIFRNGKEQRPLVPYSKFIKHISSIDEKESDSFWRSQFPSIVEGYPRLPSDYTPRPQSNKDTTIHFRRPLSSETTAATVIQAAWAILMSTYSAGEDVAFGLTLSGRDAPIDGITDIIGPALTSVPVSVHLDQNMTLGEVLDDMQNKTADIRKFQHVGLQRIRRLSPEASAAADFRNLLIVHNMEDEDITSPLRALGLQTMKSKAEETLDFGLTVECTIRPDALHVLINYDNKVVADRQVDFILGQLEHIISILVEEPKTTKLCDIDLVSSYDLKHLKAWNSKIPNYTSETLHELVQGQARLTPDAIATTGFDGEYTYKELDTIADRLAAHLALLGVGLEKHVVLSFRKSTWPIIAMLAVLKSGGVCVSVNFEHPLSRRLEIIQDIEPVLVLCDAEQEGQYSGYVPKVVVIDAALFATSLTKVSSDWLRPEVQPTNAAFVVYTSGSSSGKPKGCILEHHAVCLSQKTNADAMNITCTTRTLQFATYTWDPSILEIFGPLIRGGSVCVISDDERMNNLTATINARKATWTFQTPTVAQLIDPKEVPTLKTIVFCGEPLTQKAVQPWSAAGHARLINFYSAAETSNIGTINFEPNNHLGLISIGRANGCGLWIVKRGSPERLAPVGCVGELLVEGHAVIRGYWRRTVEDLAAFIKAPAWSRSEGDSQRHRRFYKTGDIGYFNHDGSVQLLGRADRQVKLNGMRVELHEIEYQIHQQLPARSEVTVEIVHWGVATLTAFIKLPAFTLPPDDSLSVEHEEQLKEFQIVLEGLQQSLPARLPQYMVPSAFVPISSTPKLATTKTDRRRLTQFAQGLSKNAVFGSGLTAVKELPSNSIEASLQLVWSQVLKQQLSEIGVTDNFLSLGGDSITAMQAVSECRRLGLKLLVCTILEEKTIVAIAPHCTLIPSNSTSASGAVVEAADTPRGFPIFKFAIEELTGSFSRQDAGLGLGVDGGLIDDIYPCTAMQEGILLSQQMDNELYQIYCIWEFTDDPVPRENLPSRLAQAWESMVQRHSSLRTGIVEHATEYGHFVQVVLKSHPKSRFTEAKEVIHDASEVSAIPEPDEDGLCAYLPRLTVYPTTKGRHACRLSVNHVLIDGTSTDIFMEELISLLIGQTLVSPAMDFSKYVEYEQTMKSGQSIEYWADHLKDVQPCLISMEKHHEVANTVQQFGFIKLPARATDGLAVFCRRLGITQAAFIQTAWAIVLGAFTSQDDVCFGYIASGRDAPLDGIEGSIGPFISMQVCRVRISETVDEVLKRVHRNVIAGLEHRNCSLALIQSALGLKATPLFNTCMTIRRALEDAEQTKLDSMIKLMHGPEKTEFAISLSAYVGSTSTQISMSYQEGKTSQEYASSIAGSLETAIQSLMVSGSELARTIEVISAHERELIEHRRKPVDVQSLQTDSNKKQPSNEMEHQLQTVWVKVLNHPASRVGVFESFMSLGGDSIAAMQVAAQCRKIDIKLPVSVILQKKTIAAIAPYCKRAVAESVEFKSTKTADGTSFNLSPIQKRYFDQESATGWTKYNQNMLCRIKKGVPARKLKEAFDLIVNRHGMLRARFTQDLNRGWRQSTMPPGKDLHRFISHSLKDISEDITPRMEESADSLDIVNGPVFSVDFFDVPNQDGMVFLVSHHLVIDIVSWQGILREVEEFIVHGKLYSRPSLTFQQWCSIQEVEAASDLSAEQVLPLDIPPSQFEYWQISDNTFEDLVEESFELPAFITDLVLAKNNEALGTTPLEILLGPLLSSFHQAFPDRNVPSIFIEQHGREPCGDNGIEPSQVIGWFTSMYPIHVPVDSSTTALEAIRLVKDTRRRVPRNGRPYFAYRHINVEGAEKFSKHDPVEILVNYTGIFRQFEDCDSLIQLESRVKSNISNAGPRTHRLAMIDIEMGVSHGIMTLHFGLNRRMAHLDRVRQWIQNYKNILSQTAIDLAGQSPTHTLSDFPLLDFSYEQLASLLSTDLPQLGIKSGEDIEDIFPVTPFQHFSLEGHWATPPRHWDCLFFDLPKGVDVAKLRETCFRVVQHTPILRTLFIKQASGFLQIVLKSLEPQIESYDSKEDANLFMERLFNNDLAQLPPLGKSLLRFIIMRTPTQSRLLLRISHAQDDGFSRMVMVKALAATYDGERVPESICFSNYVRHAKQHHKEGIKYWRSVLIGAQPTSVLKVQPQPTLKKADAIRVEKTVPTFPTLDGVTSATIFNAACALLLHSLVKCSDVTFGRITSGRAGLDSDFQDLMGPCINIVPIRVQFQNVFRPSDALQLVHKQYAESIPYETTGLDDIIRECTTWSTSMAKFPVITQHVNQEKGYQVQSAGGGSFDGHVWEAVDEDPFPWSLCLGAFPGRNGVRISIAANSAHTDKVAVERIMEGLCGFIGSVTQNLDV